MVSGALPYDVDSERNYLALYDNIINGEWKKYPEFTNELDNLLEGMLHKNPNLRFTVDEVLHHYWTEAYFEPVKSTPILAYIAEKSKKEKKGRKHNNPISPVCENLKIENEILKGCHTTMIPYLSSMFMEEIEHNLKTCGSLAKWNTDDLKEIQENDVIEY
jgi:serine/threonine protein kinase